MSNINEPTSNEINHEELKARAALIFSLIPKRKDKEGNDTKYAMKLNEEKKKVFFADMKQDEVSMDEYGAYVESQENPDQRKAALNRLKIDIERFGMLPNKLSAEEYEAMVRCFEDLRGITAKKEAYKNKQEMLNEKSFEQSLKSLKVVEKIAVILEEETETAPEKVIVALLIPELKKFGANVRKKHEILDQLSAKYGFEKVLEIVKVKDMIYDADKNMRGAARLGVYEENLMKLKNAKENFPADYVLNLMINEGAFSSLHKRDNDPHMHPHKAIRFVKGLVEKNITQDEIERGMYLFADNENHRNRGMEMVKKAIRTSGFGHKLTGWDFSEDTK